MSSRRAWSAIGLLALMLVLLRLPTVDTGLHMDDIAQRAMVEGAYPGARSPWDLYTFSTGDPGEVATLKRTGALPWWSDPSLRLSALRPLSSVLVWIDATALDARAAHVHSLIWWFAMLVALGWALVPILGARWAWLAVALYGLDDAHALPLAWLANRAAILSGVFGWLALGLYARASKASSPWLLPLAAVTTASMAAGEYGLSALAYVVVYALVMDRRPWKDRLRALVPVLLPIAGYLLLHRVGGFGAAHSGVYIDPAAEPLAFVGALLERAPRLLIDMATGTPQLLLTGWSAAAVWGTAFLVFGVGWALARWLHPQAERRRAIAWALGGAVVAVVPVCASFLSDRLTVLASVGAHIVSAAVLLAALERMAERRVHASSVVAVAVAGGLLFGHGWVASGSSAAKVDALRRFNRAGLALVANMPVEDARASEERWVLLAAGDPMMLVYPPHLRSMLGRPRPAAWTVLCLAKGPLSMRRVSATALEITAASGWMQTPLERFFRRKDRPLSPEQTEGFEGMKAEVTQVEDGVPMTVRFTFDRPLDDPALRLMSMGMRGVFRYPLAGVGATMPLAPGVDAIAAEAGPVSYTHL
ncbi:MAG: hypothetical protein KUG77_22010, partial [Nannocystaceae bacterium]|nr:hypothetical protein [Nannocystaceae bacterium]